MFKRNIIVNTNNGDIMDLKTNDKVLKSLMLILIIYISILIINKLNILTYICILLKLLTPLFIGIIIDWLFRPIINYLEHKGMNRISSLIILYVLFIIITYMILKNIIPTFIEEFNEFVKLFPKIFDDFFNSIKITNVDNIKKEVMCFIDEFILNFNKNMPNTCINIVGSISSILVGFVIAFYLLISNNTINVSKYVKRRTYNLLNKINNILYSYVKGTIFSSFIVFILSTLIFYICGLKSALLLGFICGVTNIIPFIGPYIGGVIPVLIAFTKSVTFGIIITAMLFIIQTIEGNIIHPLIMSKSVNIHPVTSMVSLIIFGYFFGIVGMIIAVPIVAILKEVYFYYYKKYN